MCTWHSTDEWNNFLERVYPKKEDREAKKALLKTIFPKEFKFKENEQPRKPEDLNEDVKLKLRLWASYRGQTLARTGKCIVGHVGLFSASCFWVSWIYEYS